MRKTLIKFVGVAALLLSSTACDFPETVYVNEGQPVNAELGSNDTLNVRMYPHGDPIVRCLDMGGGPDTDDGVTTCYDVDF